MTNFLASYSRTHYSGELRRSHVGQEVVLLGWVQGRRDLGGRIFIDLRDRSGLSQLVFGPDICTDAHREADALRSEFCIGIVGTVKLRVNSINPGIVETEGSKAAGFIGSPQETLFVSQTPLGRTGQPDDIADIAVFLASDASRWLTGEKISASGGLR